MKHLSLISFFVLFVTTFALPKCGQICKFRLCRSNEFLAAVAVGAKHRPGAAGVVNTPFICSLTQTITKVTTGEPMIQTGTTFTPMKSWSAASFPAKFYFAKTINGFGGRRGITHKTNTPAQWAVLNNECIKLPILKVGNTKLSKNPSNCVSFRTQNPRMEITTSWNNDNDVDMRVVEPDTETVAAGSPSTDGVHAGDFNFDACGKVDLGKEIVTYATTTMPGQYCVKLRMKNKCGGGKTKYRISVAVQGVEFTAKSGQTNAAGGDFENFCFTLA